MTKWLRNAVDTLVAGGSLVLVVWLIAGSSVVGPVFWTTIALIGVLYVLAYVTPRPMERVMSMPYAFRIDQNWGTGALEMQAVTYAAYHTRWLANLTHIGFVVDAVAWSVLTYAIAGWWGIAALVALKVGQIMSYGERSLLMILSVAWLGVATAGVVGYTALGREDAVLASMTVVIVSAIWRVVGHAAEPIPPGVSGSHRFVPIEDLGLRPSLGASAAVGYVAEAASGVPFRLFDVWVFDTASRVFGYRPRRLIDKAEIDRQRGLVFENGWGAAPATAHLLSVGQQQARRETRPSTLPPYPNGWYAVAFSDEIVPGQIRSQTFCGRDIVLYRTVGGAPVVMGAHCPHLGADFGIGGTVVGETIRCPFHGFCFDPSGTCVETGYGSEVPRRLEADTWPVIESDGVIFAWHHELGAPPSFLIPDSPVDGWSELRHHTFRLRDHPQETTENGVDLGHFAVVHGYESVEMLEPITTAGAYLTTKYSAERPMPWLSSMARPVRFEFAPRIHGLGYSLVDVAIPDMALRARLLVLATPVDGVHIDLRLGLRLAAIEQPGRVHPLARMVPRRVLQRLIARFILAGFADDAARDFPIWENKAYIDQPRLAKGDGPIGVYRSWAKQFYAEFAAREVEVTIDLRAPVEELESS